MTNLKHLILYAALGVSSVSGQTLDSSGNGLLKGTFHFRQLQASNFNQTTGDLTEAVAISGTVNFDGAGNCTFTGTSIDNTVSNGSPQTVNVTRTYVIGANGTGYIADPLDSTNYIYGAVAQGIFVGSATEGVVNNKFIAFQAAPAPANATFTGSYWAGLIDFPGASSAALKNALFQLTPNGQGSFGSITLTGQAANQTSSSLTQNVTGATYTFPGDGSISANVPTPPGISAANALLSGVKTLFVSKDGNFILGYTPNGYDLIFGVKTLSSSATPGMYSGLYYTSALEDGPSLGNTCGTIDSFYGSLIADGNNNQIVHQRLAQPFCPTIDFQTDDLTNFTSNGNATDFNGYSYAFGVEGQAFVGIGTNGFYSLMTGVHSNTFTGTGVFLNPIGVTNAASFAPITTSVAPGELITLYGSGLAGSTQSMQGGQAFPTTLGDVQVLVNGTAAPIYYVSPTQISAILPYSIGSSVTASIQVSNKGTKSDPVVLYTTDAIPGVFSQTQNGLGLAAALHSTSGQLVTTSNPAVPGEYISLYLTGLGTVTPAINDGALGPASTLSYADAFNSKTLTIYFDDYTNQVFPQANVTFGGLAPGLAGLYQINVQVPTGIGPGKVYIEVATDYADVNQIQVPVGSATSASLTAQAAQARSAVRQSHGKPVAERSRAAKKSTLKTQSSRQQFPN